ncbi:uncharacterized protein LOC117315666 [Pecten maximus]|uniref:uncharacterized protein LOC117315666 n=1 Tax=Pecten maximus TaxID=6579 RepID=UPI001458FA6B|nr:uncharacterized protein LOC117315666 [Pecten maximus]
MEDIGPEWQWFLSVYICVLVMYGLFSFAILFNMLFMWKIRNRIQTVSEETPDQITIEKQTASNKHIVSIVITEVSDASISSSPSNFSPMSTISSVSQLDARSLDNVSAVEPLIVNKTTTTDSLQPFDYSSSEIDCLKTL